MGSTVNGTSNLKVMQGEVAMLQVQGSYSNLLRTQISPEHFLSLWHCRLPSSPEQHSAEWSGTNCSHRGDPHKDTILLGLRGVCIAAECEWETKHSKHARKHNGTSWNHYLCWCVHSPTQPQHSHFMIKCLMYCPTPQLAENEGRTIISHLTTSYLMESLSRC